MKYVLLSLFLVSCISQGKPVLTTSGRSFYYVNVPNLGTVHCYGTLTANNNLDECYLQGSSRDELIGTVHNATNYLFYKGEVE